MNLSVADDKNEGVNCFSRTKIRVGGEKMTSVLLVLRFVFLSYYASHRTNNAHSKRHVKPRGFKACRLCPDLTEKLDEEFRVHRLRLERELWHELFFFFPANCQLMKKVQEELKNIVYSYCSFNLCCCGESAVLIFYGVL